jgi:hypothetical protein
MSNSPSRIACVRCQRHRGHPVTLPLSGRVLWLCRSCGPAAMIAAMQVLIRG